jgi:hypothetical protein
VSTVVDRVTGAPTSTASFTPGAMPTHDNTQSDRVRLIVTGKDNTMSTPTISGGSGAWTFVGTATGGTGATAADTGICAIFVWERDVTSSSESAPTVTAGATAPDSWEYALVTVRPAAGKVAKDAVGTSSQLQTGSDTSTGTGTGATLSAFSPQITAGDALILVAGVPTDSKAGSISETASATGLSGGTLSTPLWTINGLGNDSGIMLGDWTGFTGTATSGLTMNFNHASSGSNVGTGVIAAIIFREISATALTGSGDGSSEATATFTITDPLTGSGDGCSEALGTLTVATPLTGSGDGASEADAALTPATPLAGSGDGSSEASADYTIGTPLTGSADGSSDAEFFSGVVPQVLNGSADAASEASADLTIVHMFATEADASSDAYIVAVTATPLDSQGDGSSDASAALVAVTVMSGSGSGASEASATFTVTAVISASSMVGTGASDASAEFSVVAGSVGVTVQWWDGTALQTATLLGWWDGSAIQPASADGWWDGAAVQPFA